MNTVSSAIICKAQHSTHIPLHATTDEDRSDICDNLNRLICTLQQDGAHSAPYSQILKDEAAIDAFIAEHQDSIPNEVLNGIDPFFDRLNSEYQSCKTFPQDLMPSFFKLSGSCFSVISLILIQNDLENGDQEKLRIDSQSIIGSAGDLPVLKDVAEKLKEVLADFSEDNIQECMDSAQTALDNI